MTLNIIVNYVFSLLFDHMQVILKNDSEESNAKIPALP